MGQQQSKQVFKCPVCNGDCEEKLGKDRYTSVVFCACGFEQEMHWSEPIRFEPYKVAYGTIFV